MKIIKGACCRDCPYCRFEFENNRKDHFDCHEAGVTLATENQVIIKEAEISPITMEITREEKGWKFTTDGDGTVWDSSKIPEWCPLENEMLYREWLIDLRDELKKDLDDNLKLYAETHEYVYDIRAEQLRKLIRTVISVTGS
jgi:hypothetical protein